VWQETNYQFLISNYNENIKNTLAARPNVLKAGQKIQFAFYYLPHTRGAKDGARWQRVGGKEICNSLAFEV